jgi:hypothetical protein
MEGSASSSRRDLEAVGGGLLSRLAEATSLSLANRRGFLKAALVAFGALGMSLVGARPASAATCRTCTGPCSSCETCTGWCCEGGYCYGFCCSCAVWCICTTSRYAKITVCSDGGYGTSCVVC